MCEQLWKRKYKKTAREKEERREKKLNIKIERRERQHFSSYRLFALCTCEEKKKSLKADREIVNKNS